MSSFSGQSEGYSSSTASSPSRYSATSSRRTSIAASSSSPPTAILYSPTQSPIRTKPVHVVGNPLQYNPRISQFPLPPASKPSAPAVLDPPVQLPIGQAALDSPTLPSPEEEFVSKDQNRFSREDYHKHPGQRRASYTPSDTNIRVQLPTPGGNFKSPVSSNHARVISESILNLTSRKSISSKPHSRSASASVMASVHPHISLKAGIMNQDSGTIDLEDLIDESPETVKPKSNRFTSIFRWGSSSEQGGAATRPTSGADQGPPPAISPRSRYPPPLPVANTRFVPSAIDIPLANASQSLGMLSDSGASLPPLTSSSSSSVEAIEEEVRAVSADLAASIRREMDLEDLVERLQAEAAENSINGRRTSDYFSDAGTPARVLDTGIKEVDAEKMIRKVEQEKAQIRLDLLEKVREERERRRMVETQVRDLEGLVAKNDQPLPQSLNTTLDPEASARAQSLEAALEDAKRKLAEERTMKENFEDLLSALKEELEINRNERDELRDTVVPQLKARVEGLETEASELQKLMYEHSRMQQELMGLKNENASLARAIQEKTEAQIQAQANIQAQIEAQVNAQVEAQIEAQAQAQAHAAEVHVGQAQAIHAHAVQAQVVQAHMVQIQTNITRQSVQGSPSGYATPSTPTSTMVIPLNSKDRDNLGERVKELEAQRKELHSALKRLREWQQIEARKARERIKALELERERNLKLGTKRQGRDKEVSALRREVDRLRQRADDALEQKAVCERSLGTVKMDLEKAEQETNTLRMLLQQHDALIAQHEELKNAHVRLSREVSELNQGVSSEASSVTLQQAYRDLLVLHERTLVRLDELAARGGELALETEQDRLSKENVQSQQAIEELRKLLTEAETDRDSAVEEAEGYRKRAESLQKAESMHMREERSLAAQLRTSSERIEELATQVRAQLSSNEALRDRLADCITRGEDMQRISAKKINGLQDKLRLLEDKVVEAQQAAEEAVLQHEEEVRRIKEVHTAQLRRLKSSVVKSPGFSSRMPSPLLRGPNLEWTSKRFSPTDRSKAEYLEKRVGELERALNDADGEMSEVVARMNAAQIEVLELQNERDDALRTTRRLQTDFITQQAKFARLS